MVKKKIKSMKKIEEALTIYHKFKEAKVQDNHMDGFEKVFRDLLPENWGCS